MNERNYFWNTTKGNQQSKNKNSIKDHFVQQLLDIVHTPFLDILDITKQFLDQPGHSIFQGDESVLECSSINRTGYSIKFSYNVGGDDRYNTRIPKEPVREGSYS